MTVTLSETQSILTLDSKNRIQGYQGRKMDNTEETFGAYVRRHRLANKLTQDELGKSIGVTRGYISMIETDNNPYNSEPPRLDPAKMDDLARALRVAPHELKAKSWLGDNEKRTSRAEHKQDLIRRMKLKHPHFAPEVFETMAEEVMEHIYGAETSNTSLHIVK